MEIRTYKQVLNYLERFIGKIVFKVDAQTIKQHHPLERMRVLLDLLGNPQDKFRSIIVGGTSGKGSTAYLISHILKTAGYKTGFTLSPHLQKVNERLQINGKQISDAEFVKLLNSVKPAIEKMKNSTVGGPSYFEIIVAMAFKYFADQKVDIAVVEVGMGGEFDATNTLNPLIAVLTNVGLDHTAVLGKTVEKIAKTKAGIIKSIKYKVLSSKYSEKQIVVSGIKQRSVIKIVQERCGEVDARLYLLQKDFEYEIKKESLYGTVFDFKSDKNNFRDFHLSLLGKFQVENASLAIQSALKLKEFGFAVSEEGIRKALRTAFFPGRFEILDKDIRILGYKDTKRNEKVPGIPVSQYHNIPIILDGAHNPVKMRAFLSSLKKLFPNERKIFVIGFKFDKDISKMLKEIAKAADLPAGRQGEIIVTEFKRKTDMVVSASADAKSIKYEVLSIKYRGKVSVEKDSKKALEKALAISNLTMEQFSNGAIIVITGSLYLVGEVRGLVEKIV